MEEKGHKKVLLIGLIIVLLILIAFWIYNYRAALFEGNLTDIQFAPPPSDDVASINADLQKEDFSNLDKELSDIDKEFNQ